MSTERENTMLSHQLGNFVSTLTYDQLPKEVVAEAKTRILDLVASAFAGVQLGTYKGLMTLIAPTGDGIVWGEGTKTSLRDAVLVNSFISHAAYLEDGSRFSGGHPSSAVIPAALTLAASTNSSGKDFISAVIAGYEIFLRLGRIMYPAATQRGFQPTAILGSIASAAACANLLRLSPDQSANALTIACNFSAGLKEATKSPAIHPVQVAHSCHGGLIAALLAKEGEQGSDAIFENGFLPAYAGVDDGIAILDGLGSRFCIGETYLKIHGGCRGNHAPIDVMLDLKSRQRITPDQVRSITVQVDSVTYAAEIHEPKTGEQAQFSVAFCVAAALLDGHASIFQYSDQKLADPHVRDFMRRTNVVINPKLDEGYPNKRGALITVSLHDGQEFTGSIDNAKGEPESPFSLAEIEDKFILLTKPLLGENEKILRENILSLEILNNMKDIVQRMKSNAFAIDGSNV